MPPRQVYVVTRAEAAAIPIRPHTTTYPLGQANRALADLKADRIRGTGVLVME